LLSALAAGALAAPLAPARVAPRPPAVVTITTRDFAFEAPASVPAGLTTIRLVNRGPDIHHVQLLRITQGKRVSDALAALKSSGPPPAWLVDAGGPNAPAPGAESMVTLTLEAGQYLIVCFVDTPDHVPHMAKGMTRALTVTPSKAPPATPPTADATLALSDYAFALSPLRAGKHVIRVTNGAAQSHEALLVRFAPGKGMKDLIAWAQKYQGPPPGTPLGGVTAVARGQTEYLHIDLAPGHYGLICFVPDAKDGKAHVVHGMSKEFDVM
jgi:hypothetical protein